MSDIPRKAIEAAERVFIGGGDVEAMIAAAAPFVRADERARIRSLLPYNVNCCDGFGAAVADLIGEHGDC